MPRLPRVVVAALLPPFAAAAEDPLVLPEIVVTTPTRTPVEAARTGSSVSVVTAEDLAAEPAPTLSKALERVPGVAVAGRGAPGASAEVSVRGFGAEDVLLRVDGIEFSDPGELRTQPDFAHVLTGDLSRIEVLKGAQSALYGGEAVGGVIDATSARARGSGFSARAFAEGGSYLTARGGVSVGAGYGDWDLTATAQGLRTDGFSAAASGTEDDGYRNVTLSTVGSVDVAETLTFGGAARFLDRETEIDGATGGVPVDALYDTASSEVIAGRAFARHSAIDDRLVNELSIQRLASTREFDQESTGISRYEGDRLKLEWLGTFVATERVDLLAGADWTREAVETSDGLDVDSEIAGGFAQVVASPVDALTLTGALRHDGHSEFGGYTTWRATAALEPVDGTTLRGAIGTGFRAPSNRELFSPAIPGFGPVGNADLEPEETFSWEIGVDQALFGGRARASATYFDARTDELIAFVFGTGYTQIPGESRRSGVELGLEARATDWLDVSAAYTFLEAEDADGARLDYVPRHDARVGLIARPLDRVTLAASANYVSGVRDDGETLDPFLLVNATATYAATEQMDVYVRVENLLDQDYERVDGFATSGIAAYLGVRASF